MEKLFGFISQFTRLSPESREALASICERMEFPKGHVLLRPGAICHYIYYIESGLTRTYYIKDGKEVTDWISRENTIAVSLISFLTRKPDIRGIELLEPASILALPFQGLEALYQKFHEIERLGRLLVSFGAIQMQQRFDELHFVTAHQRYQGLLETHPDLIQRVPLGMIASYLGVTQETLSRIRGKRH